MAEAARQRGTSPWQPQTGWFCNGRKDVLRMPHVQRWEPGLPLSRLSGCKRRLSEWFVRQAANSGSSPGAWEARPSQGPGFWEEEGRELQVGFMTLSLNAGVPVGPACPGAGATWCCCTHSSGLTGRERGVGSSWTFSLHAVLPEGQIPEMQSRPGVSLGKREHKSECPPRQDSGRAEWPWGRRARPALCPRFGALSRIHQSYPLEQKEATGHAGPDQGKQVPGSSSRGFFPAVSPE